MMQAIRVYTSTASRKISSMMTYRLGMIGYILGKILRMSFFLVFALAMFQKNKTVAGFNAGEIILFYAVMNFFDVITQMFLLRGFTYLPRDISRGSFDLLLTRPTNIFAYITGKGFDVFDFFTVPAAIGFIAVGFAKLGYIPSFEYIVLGILMCTLSFIALIGIFIGIASISFYTNEVENVWWFYRDIAYSARNPAEFFPRVIQIIFTYAVPILVIITYPTRAFLGILSAQQLVTACIVAVVSNVVGITLWRRGLRKYSSVG